MILNPIRFLTAIAASAVFAGAVHAQTAIITKARASVGPDAALDAVTSVHYTGKLVGVDPADPSKEATATIDIIFQKPFQHRVTLTTDTTVEITGLDNYVGWQRRQDKVDATRFNQAPASADQVKRLRASAWESLSFFRGIETQGGRMEVMQPATMEGVACNKVAFIYAPDIIFYRYFDQATGRLIITETENGNTLKEEGEIMVNGIRFPKRIVNVQKNPAGKPSKVTITFDQIKVNEKFPDSLFVIPSLRK
jgi:hypothetical protein